jgi:LCP family protein required for cell wall assembly
MLGVDEIYNNVDSIFIVSISNSKKTIKVVSVPRDAYVPYPENIANLLKSPKYYFKGIFKVNAAFHVGNNILNYQDGIFESKGINFLCSVLDGLLVNVDLTIHDYIRVNFEGFTEIVDIAGGVYVDVPEDMYNSNGKLFLAKGRQFLNSKQALEFVRRRHRYDSNGKMISSSGDPYRKANQLAFLNGCAEQLITVESISKAPQILESLSKNVHHSVNNFSKLSKYMGIAMDYANGKYEVELLLIKGKSVDPVGDRASYVDIIT